VRKHIATQTPINQLSTPALQDGYKKLQNVTFSTEIQKSPVEAKNPIYCLYGISKFQ
jgi:hypothetical protein